MQLKSYIRKGILDEALKYEELINFDGSRPKKILLILEGKGRRKISLTERRFLYETYFPMTFIGLEDLLLDKSRKGGSGVFPGTHYVLWDADDLLNTFQSVPELTRKAIYSLSKRIRIYNERSKKTDIKLKSYNLKNEKELFSDTNLKKTLYQLTFSDEEEFPSEIIEKFVRPFKKGEYLFKEGDKTKEIYIILSGDAIVLKKDKNNAAKQINTLSTGDFIGEMSLFDGLPRSADVIADSDMLTLLFDPDNFYFIFQLHPKWGMRILHTLAERVEHRRREFETLPINSLYYQ